MTAGPKEVKRFELGHFFWHNIVPGKSRQPFSLAIEILLGRGDNGKSNMYTEAQKKAAIIRCGFPQGAYILDPSS